MPPVVTKLAFALALSAAFCSARQVCAQSVRAELSTDEAFVGEAVYVDVTVSNMPGKVEPIPPATEDFEITPDPGNPVQSGRRVSIINGRRSESVDAVYRYYVRPLRVGRLVLPPFSVESRGRVSHSQQFPITVVKDTSGSLLLCVIKCPHETIYVGQPVELTLEVWVQPYTQADIGTLSTQSMWSGALLNTAATSLGALAEVDLGSPNMRRATHEDEDGVRREYYVYSFEAVVYPKTPGEFDFGDVAIAYNYPRKLGRDWFGNPVLQGTRRLRATAEKPKLIVRSVPLKGRPPDFNGAIGTYTIRARAKPTEVPVGDPITLTLDISGRGLERLSAPRLDQVEALTRDFEVPGESLAGEIRNNRKRFTQTIRALREDVSEIPPIPMSYFVAETGRFETDWSEPIPLTVRPAERLVMSNLQSGGVQPGVLAPLSETTDGLLANSTDPAKVLADQSGRLGPGTWALLVAMPLVYLATWFIQRRALRYRDDEAFRRRSRAASTAKRALNQAGAAGLPGHVRAALAGYVADRCNVPAAGLTRADAITLLTQRSVPQETVQAIDALLDTLELAEYGGGADDSARDRASEAADLVDTLERMKLK
ncbi:MAG: BatD family protein [Planctomycetota bacterium]